MKSGTDKKQQAAKLRAMAQYLSAQDKTDAALKVGCHTNTIHNYLRGDIGDEKVAEQLIEVFTQILNRQVKKIQQITSTTAA